MADQVVWINGGAGGIGSALARLLVDRGDRVVLTGRRVEPLEELAGELGPNASWIQADVTQAADCDRAVQTLIERHGQLDGLAHCVGSIILKPTHLATPEEMLATIQTNLLSAMLASRAALGPIRKQGKGGSIVLVSTVAATQGLNNHDVISAAKAGINGYVRSAAMTYSRDRIRFNAVAPGLTDTPLAAPLLRSDASRAFSEAMHPLGRIGQPDEIARVIALLLGPDSGWITGQVWGIDGGLAAGVTPPRPQR